MPRAKRLKETNPAPKAPLLTEDKTPKCPKCNQPCNDVLMEAIVAPPAPTMYLTKYSCTRCK